jgi:glycosyltransferase involved in cell wall biosynthesis
MEAVEAHQQSFSVRQTSQIQSSWCLMAPRNLRVLLVAYHFPPMNSSGVQRPLAMQKLLPRFGVDVSVLTHTYSRSDLLSEPNVLRVYDTNSNGASKLLHYPLRVLQRGARALGRSTSWHGVWMRGVKRRADSILEIAKPDIVVSTYPPVETLDLGLHLSKKYGVPLVADFRDGLLFEPIEAEMLRSTRTRARYQQIEQDIARHSAGILTVSDPISDYFRAQYQHAAVLTLPNGFDPDEPWVEPSSDELDRSRFNLVYTGRLSLSEKGRHASVFTQTVTRLVKDSPAVADKLRIHFVGEFSAAEKAEWSALIDAGVVRFHGLLSRPRALGFQRAATMLLLVASSGKTSVATGKLFEYLNAGRPILGVTRNTAAEKIILETRAGVVVDPADGDAIYGMLERLVLEPHSMASIDPCAAEVQKYSRHRQMEVLASFLKGLVPAAGAADR